MGLSAYQRAIGKSQPKERKSGRGKWTDSERLPIAAVVSDKNVAGGGAPSRSLSCEILPFTRCLELANIEKRRVEGKLHYGTSLDFHALRNVLDM